MFWIFFYIFVGLYFIKYFINVYKFNNKLRRFPSPPGYPLLGHSLYFFNSSKGLLDIGYGFVRNYGENIIVKIGLKRLLLTIDYKLIKFILSHPDLLKKSRHYDYLNCWLGTGLLLNSGDSKWKKHRKIITPAFHFKILEDYIGIFHSSTQILIKKLKKFHKNEIDITPLLSLCTLDIICESAMGTSMNVQENENCEYVNCVKQMCRIMVERSFSLWKAWNFFYYFSEDYRIQTKSLKILHDYTNTVIEAKLKSFKKIQKLSEKHDDDIGIKKKNSFLDLLLLKMETQNLSLNDIREEVDTFMFAGHDTTSTTIGFLLYNLAKNPEIQEKAFQEQRDIFKNDLNRTLIYQDLCEMKYLDLIIKESLRLYPSVPYFSRELEKNVMFDGEILPKGIDIGIFSFALHRNPKYFPNPEKFDPNRFENRDGKHPYAYIPFSSGPRNCLGQKFAIISVKSIVSELIRNFKFLDTNPPHQLKLQAETILTSENGIKVKIIKR